MRKALLGLMLLPCVVLACPAGYESQAALAKAARLIIGVKVESVTDISTPTDKEVGLSERADEEDRHNHAQAKVKVTEIIRGTCPIKEFTLRGGPYETCAPFDRYVPFDQGASLFLLLDRPLPEGTKTVVITWRCRVFEGTKEELLHMLEKAEAGWTQMVELHRALFPDAMARAEELLPASLSKKAGALPPGESYACLACLRLLLCDQQHLRTSQSKGVEADSNAAMFSGGKRSPKTRRAGVYLTAHHTSPWQSADLDKALIAMAAAHPKEAAAFNRSLLLGCLARHYGVPQTDAEKIADAEEVAACLPKVQVSPLSFDLDLPRDEQTSPLTRSASFLLAIADDEDDRMVWRTFGMGMGDNYPALDPSVFLPYLDKQPEQFTESWGGICLLLSMPDARISPHVRKVMLQTDNINRLTSFFEFFARLGDETACADTLDRLGKLAAEEGANARDEEQRHWILECEGRVVTECGEAADKAKINSAPVRERLKKLTDAYSEKPKAAEGS